MSEIPRLRHVLRQTVSVTLRPYWRLHALIAAGVVMAV